MTRVWIIEHSKRGYYIGHDWDKRGDHYGPRFKWSIPVTDDRVWRAYNEYAAEREYRRLEPVSLRSACRIATVNMLSGQIRSFTRRKDPTL